MYFFFFLHKVYNSYGLLSKERAFASTEALISYDGSIIWVPISNMVSICIPDATYYPFDSVTCTTTVGSWTYNALKINFSPKNNETTVQCVHHTIFSIIIHLKILMCLKVDMTEMISNRIAEWKMMSTQIIVEVKKYDCCTEPYQSMKMKFTIQRSLSTLSAITMPTIGSYIESFCLCGIALMCILLFSLVIVVLILATFFIPPAINAKLIVGVFNLAVLSAYLLYFKTVLPAGSINTPLIGNSLNIPNYLW